MRALRREACSSGDGDPFMQRAKGITLVELVIAVAAMGIIAALAIPSLSSLYAMYSLKSAAREIAVHLELAKMKAISSNREHRVEFVGTTFRIARGNSASDSTTWAPETEYLPLPEGITITGMTFPQDNGLSNAEFNPDGTSSTGSITLQNSSGDRYQITLTTSTGRVKVKKL